MHQLFRLRFALPCAALLACAASDSGSQPGLTTNTTSADVCGCPAQQVEYVHRPLACACDSESGDLCPATLDDALAALCPAGGRQAVVQMEGCGKVRLDSGGGYGGVSPTFDAESGALIGLYEFSDVAGGTCNAFGYISGDALFVGSGLRVGASCPEADYCMACGSGAYPACSR
jgi:hypothetical protein